MVEFRFWNAGGENIKVAGKYSHVADTESDAKSNAEALLISASKAGAIEVDFNNVFYDIVDD